MKLLKKEWNNGIILLYYKFLLKSMLQSRVLHRNVVEGMCYIPSVFLLKLCIPFDIFTGPASGWELILPALDPIRGSGQVGAPLFIYFFSPWLWMYSIIFSSLGWFCVEFWLLLIGFGLTGLLQRKYRILFQVKNYIFQLEGASYMFIIKHKLYRCMIIDYFSITALNSE